MALGPESAGFWDADDLWRESLRVHKVCADCRLCFKYCGSFPALFEAVDKNEGEVARLRQEDLDAVVDRCFQCKLCYVNCPYTPGQHEWAIDFPRLMLRSLLVKTKGKAPGVREKLLGNPHLLGRLGGLGTPLSNWANEWPLFRRVLESVLGIHRHRQLPRFHGQSFLAWAKRSARSARADQPLDRVALFATCAVNHHWPEVGRAAHAVLAHNRTEITAVPMRCCGMPALESGDLEGTRRFLDENLELLHPLVERGYKIVMPQPTCGYMVRQEYPWLSSDPRARAVAAATRDLCEYLMERAAAGTLRTDFRETKQLVAYHLPCHLKAQNLGYKSRDLMQLIPGTKVRVVDRCSGMDGGWGMRRHSYAESRAIGEKLLAEFGSPLPDRVVSDCTLAGLQINQGSGVAVRHPIQILCEAYGLRA